MDKISKQIYQLYSDIKSMTDEQFEQHIDSLVVLKNALPSREERIKKFTLPIVNREEIVNKNVTNAFSRACEADYQPLANSIAREMITYETVNLKQLTEYPNYRQADQLKTMLTIMEEKKYVKGLLTANKEQLKYCFESKVASTLSKTFMQAIAKKKKSVLDKQTPAQAGSSNCPSRLQQAFFTDNTFGEAVANTSSKNEATGNPISKSVSRPAGLTPFMLSPAINADEENLETQKSGILQLRP